MIKYVKEKSGIEKPVWVDALCFLPWWVSFLIVLVLTVMAALLLPSRHSVCWARMLSTFCLLPVMIKSLGFELLAAYQRPFSTSDFAYFCRT